MQRLNSGETVDPALIYLRTTPRFETGDASHSWLMRYTFVAKGIRRADSVELAVYKVL
jgi:hypothetical protein